MQSKLFSSLINLFVNERIKPLKIGKQVKMCYLQQVHVAGWLDKEYLHFQPAKLSNTEPENISQPEFLKNTFSTSSYPLEQSRAHCGNSREKLFLLHFATSLFSPCLCSSCKWNGMKAEVPPLSWYTFVRRKNLNFHLLVYRLDRLTLWTGNV